jgi:hypothetical protein
MQHNRGHGPEEVRYAQVVELVVKDMGVKKGSSESRPFQRLNVLQRASTVARDIWYINIGPFIS